MRRVVFISVILTLAVTFDSMTVRASNSSVTLSAPTTGNITFSGNNGSPIMTITGPLNGMALSGTGALASATSFTLAGGSIVFTKEPGDSDGYASTGTLTFMLNNGTLLTGTLTNITLDQQGKMVVLAGTLNGEQVSMIIDLQFGTPLSKLKGPHSTELGAFMAGEAESSVTPEPGTMLLFGSGLLLVAGVLRRKLIAA
jgi:PEP-CTERM motif